MLNVAAKVNLIEMPFQCAAYDVGDLPGSACRTEMYVVMFHDQNVSTYKYKQKVRLSILIEAGPLHKN